MTIGFRRTRNNVRRRGNHRVTELATSHAEEAYRVWQAFQDNRTKLFDIKAEFMVRDRQLGDQSSSHHDLGRTRDVGNPRSDIDVMTDEVVAALPLTAPMDTDANPQWQLRGHFLSSKIVLQVKCAQQRRPRIGEPQHEAITDFLDQTSTDPQPGADQTLLCRQELQGGVVATEGSEFGEATDISKCHGARDYLARHFGAGTSHDPTTMSPDKVRATTLQSRPDGSSMRGRPDKLRACTSGWHPCGRVIVIEPDMVSTSIGP